MEFSEKGPMDRMNGHFSPIKGLESVNGIQFSLCGTPTNLIFAHREFLHSGQKFHRSGQEVPKLLGGGVSCRTTFGVVFQNSSTKG